MKKFLDVVSGSRLTEVFIHNVEKRFTCNETTVLCDWIKIL